MKRNDRGGIVNAGYQGQFAEAAPDNQAVFIDAVGIFGEYSLPGCEKTAPEKPPLSAVRVA